MRHPWSVPRLLAWGLLIAATAAIQCGPRSGPGEIDPAPLRDPAAINAGRQHFETDCAEGHGLDANGTPQGPGLGEGSLAHRRNAGDMFDIIQTGIPGTKMPAFDAPRDRVWQLVAFVRSLNARAIDDPPPGDVAQGETIFDRECAACHMVNGEGGLLGPDLSNIGGERSLASLREAIVNPGAIVRDGFRAVTVVTKTGETVEGLARNVSNFSLQMMDRRETLRLFQASEVRSWTLHDTTLMPSDFGSRLPDYDLQHLLAYVSRLERKAPEL